MSVVLTPNCFCIVGIATFTMLVSRVDMNMPTTTTASGTPHFTARVDTTGADGGPSETGPGAGCRNAGGNAGTCPGEPANVPGGGGATTEPSASASVAGAVCRP